MPGTVRSDETSVFTRLLDLSYPNIERGEGVWLTTTDGVRILDACSGGAMVTCLGYGVREVVTAAAEQAERIGPAQLPQERHLGPPVGVKNAEDFLAKWRGNRAAASEPFLEGDR